MSAQVESLIRMVGWGLEHGKRNIVADLAPLAELIAQRDNLLAATERLVHCMATDPADSTWEQRLEWWDADFNNACDAIAAVKDKPAAATDGPAV